MKTDTQTTNSLLYSYRLLVGKPEIHVGHEMEYIIHTKSVTLVAHLLFILEIHMRMKYQSLND